MSYISQRADARARRPDPHRHARGRRRLPRPEGAASGRRRGRNRDRGDRRAAERGSRILSELEYTGVQALLREFAAHRLDLSRSSRCSRLASVRSTSSSAGSRHSASTGRARRRARPRRRGSAGRPARSRGFRSGSRICSTPKVSARRTDHRCSRLTFPRGTPRRCAAPARRARSSSARRRHTSSRGGSPRSTRALGSAHNPWALDRVSGGSSGGSAVVLAADEVPLAARQRYGRLDPRSGRLLRRRGAEAHLRPDQRRRRLAARQVARPPGADGALARRTRRSCSRRSPASTRPIRQRRMSRSGRTGELAAGARRTRRRALSRPPSRPACPDVGDGLRGGTRTLACGRRRLVEVALPEAELILPPFARSRAPRRSTRIVARGLYPARRDEYGEDVLGRLDAAAEVTRRAVPRGVRRPAARPGSASRGSSTGATSSLTPVSAGSPVPIGDETVVHDGVELTFRDLVMSYTTPQDLVGPPGLRGARRVRRRSGSRSASSSRSARGRRDAFVRAAQALFDVTPEVQARRPA